MTRVRVMGVGGALLLTCSWAAATAAQTAAPTVGPSGAQAAEPTAAPTAGSPAAPALSPSPSGEPATWVRIDDPVLATLEAIAQAEAVDAGDGGDGEVIALGTRCRTDGSCEWVALASRDGTAWEERGPLPDDVNLIADLVADEEALIAVGSDDASDGAIWRSTDRGATWHGLDDREAFAPGADGRPGRSPDRNPYDVSVLAVARGPGGLVAGGWLNSEDLDRSAIWVASDPGSWERIRLPRAMDRAAGVIDLAGSEDGYVAVTAAGLWRSQDGQRWERATIDDADGPVADVEATDEGFVGLGLVPDGGSVWVAGPDGNGWQRQPDDAGPPGAWDATLRAFGSLLFVVGFRRGDELIPTVWTNQEGTTWTAETVSSEPSVLMDIARVGDALVVVGGRTPDGSLPGGVVWRRADPAT